MKFISIGVFFALFCAEPGVSQTNADKFPDDFLFGAATSALQIESAWNVDGKGEHIWDRYTMDYPDKIEDHSNTADTADSYYLYEEDVKCAKEMGLNHYRFSISWARILPNGTIDNINQKGIEYYDNLINTILKYDIEPVATVFHFDVPTTLENLGGWTNEAIVDYYVDYADLVFKLFGDRVHYWITINEPYIFCTMTYGTAAWTSPTVRTVPGRGEYLCGHNVLKAHAYAYRLYKKKYFEIQKGEVGITLYSEFYYSDTNNDTSTTVQSDGTIVPSDVKRALEYLLGWFANPIFGTGDYPAVMRQDIDRSRLPKFTIAEIHMIRNSSDFMGLNYYTSLFVTPGIDPSWPNPSFERDQMLILTTKPWWTRGASSFLFSVPIGLGDCLRYLIDEYDNPRVFITENGWSDYGDIDDQARIDYIGAHLQEVLNAKLNSGSNVIAFTVWSLVDTFEFNDGRVTKFGLYQIDFTSPNKTRRPKRSSKFMKELTATHRIPYRYTSSVSLMKVPYPQ